MNRTVEILKVGFCEGSSDVFERPEQAAVITPDLLQRG